ncbi:MAG: AAA family ATPase [Lachnospiraceae bacterium]|nr:AAA family ATPase [Lachnospiraceae bacterium]
MSKIILQNIHLVNWYGFSNTTIPMAQNLTLISGENECGKSTILDAIKYAYTGDTQFNKATSGYNTGVGKRNLVSYTRCLVDASAGIYARPAEKIPVVYTHIAMEYYDQINEQSFVLGVIIETSAADIRGTHWFAMDKKRLKDVSFVYKQESVLKPYDASEFQKKYGIQLKNKKEGITLFMQKVGLKLPYQEIPKYQRKLRNIMAYNPAAKIQEFIKESVLEGHNVNFDKLKDAKKNIEQINHSLEQINQELQDLDAILKDYNEHDRRALQLKIDDLKICYSRLVSSQKKAKDAEAVIEKNVITCEKLERVLIEENKKIEDLDRSCSEARSALRELDVTKAIEASEQMIKEYKEQIQCLTKEKDGLEYFQMQMQELLQQLRILTGDVTDVENIGKLTSRSVNAAEKQLCIDRLKGMASNCRDELLKAKGLLDLQLEEVQKECNEQTKIIENCKKNKADYTYAREQMELIGEINREFDRQGITQMAKMACEYVIGLKDEKWRDAIEVFLGVHRYAIIVLPEHFDVANQVMDRSGHKYVELVNSKRLMSRNLDCEEDSVYHMLEIQNATAAAYFTFWLGRIHAVSLDQVPMYDNAMSREGKLSRNMAVTYLNKHKLKSYCLGDKAIELNLRAAEEKRKKLEKQEKDLLARQHELQEQIDFFKNALSYFKHYNLDVHNELARATKDLQEEQGHYRELLEAQKNNEQFMALTQRVSQLEEQLAQRKKERNEHEREKTVLEVESERKTQDAKEFHNEEKREQMKLDAEHALCSSAVETAIKEFDAFLDGTNKNGGTMQPSTKDRAERRVRELEVNISGAQQAYNNRKQEVDKLPMGLDHEASYQKRRGRIWIDDLQGMQQKLREQTITYERIFKREFVLNIYETAKSARSDISDINRELRKLQFSTKYQFEVKLLDNTSDYAKILRYAEYLQDTNNMSDDQMMFTSLLGYDNDQVEARETEIIEIINRIIDKNDVNEIAKFADYRNYMSYEIIINNDEVKDGKLSKQVGYNSGAGTQIPYTLILSAALSMLYNVRVNSARLLFIDEPFEKMSDHNIKLMLDFFVNQDFQVIFCAPPNKLESIGSECGVIIPVLKVSNDNMQIGQVKFHE